MYTRRTFFQQSMVAATAVAASALSPRPLLAVLGQRPEPLPPIQDPRIKELALRALDAARSAGASYADVRLVHTRCRFIRISSDDFEWLTVGVRALVQGMWGFAASPVWSPDEMTRLARESVRQAVTGARGKTQPMTLAPQGQRAEGHWDMPVDIDPFTVPVEEILDFKSSLDLYAMKRANALGYGLMTRSSDCFLMTQSKAFGSTDGSYCTQRLFRSGGSFDWELREPGTDGNLFGGNSLQLGGMDYLSFAGAGWELWRGQPLRDYADRAIEEGIEDMRLPKKPIDVGRYDVVVDASSVADLTAATIGLATEADRVFGYEANATGTSYISDPLEMLGSYQIGAPSLTVTANRGKKGGNMTVRWDDEGVSPQDFTIVDKGVLTDLATTRESATWLGDYYAKAGKSVQSRGCAHAAQDILGRGMNLPFSASPNLTVVPGAESLDFDTCCASVTKGIAFRRLTCNLDFQQNSGLAVGNAYEIQNGKRVAILGGAGVLFKATDLWKSLTGLGGAASARHFGLFNLRGEPLQRPFQSVTAVPARFKDVSVVDVLRKA